jgi:hypothetical protein
VIGGGATQSERNTLQITEKEREKFLVTGVRERQRKKHNSLLRLSEKQNQRVKYFSFS